MNERISLADKKNEVKSRNPVPQIRRKAESSHSINSPIDRILFLQRTIGNQAVGKLIKSGTLQAKLRIGQPGDVYEQEADKVAEQVMRMPYISSDKNTRIQRKCPKCLKGLRGLLGRNKKDERLQAKEATDKTLEVAPHIEANIKALKGGGHPLPESTRAFFEQSFGHDFSRVRVHSGGAAAQSAREVNAKAYTTGHDIVFDEGRFAPETNEGQRLIAHELTHVVQQSGANGTHVDQSNEKSALSPILIHPLIQRDLAIEPPRPAAVGRALTPAQMATAITFNNRVLGSIANSADIIEMIRDIIGISPLPAVVDEDFVNGVVRWQANFGLIQDGQLGPATARPLFREIGAEGVGHGEIRRPPRYVPAGPINVAAVAAGPRGTHFDMSAEFRSNPRNGIFPSCCEVRQDIRWDAAFVATNVAAGVAPVPNASFPAAHPAGRWIEDRNAVGRYGHRSGPFSDPGLGDHYLDSRGRQNQAFGHIFEGQDNPTDYPPYMQGSWNFRLRVIDVCKGNRQLAVSPTLVVNWL